MLLVRLIQWLTGWIRFEAEGGFPERLLNLSARGGIDLWSMSRSGITLSACCPARAYRSLRAPARRAGMCMHVTERHGAPFFLRRWQKRTGIIAGVIVFAVIINIFSSRIWVIQVRGNDTVSSEQITAVLEKYGICEGVNPSRLVTEQIQLEAIGELPELAWFTVNLSGSTAYIDVAERVDAPEMVPSDAPSNIKAACDGRIISVEAYTGQALVNPGDAVIKGALLVSGVVESKTGAMFRRSHAKIMAETHREIEVVIPLSETVSQPVGEAIFRPYLHLFSLDIPLFTDGVIDATVYPDGVINRAPVTINGIPLPIGFVYTQYEKHEAVTITRTEQQAAALATDKLAELELDFGAAEIRMATRTGELRGDVYVLTGRYECIEDIAMEEPLLVEEV